VREVLESLPEEERVAYTTVQTLVYRLEGKGALRKVKKIGNAQLFQPALERDPTPQPTSPRFARSVRRLAATAGL
jgi:predicted transcriptional regulator